MYASHLQNRFKTSLKFFFIQVIAMQFSITNREIEPAVWAWLGTNPLLSTAKLGDNVLGSARPSVCLPVCLSVCLPGNSLMAEAFDF